MSVVENKALINKWTDAINHRDPASLLQPDDTTRRDVSVAPVKHWPINAVRGLFRRPLYA